jgi:hypothetical protein
MQLAFDAQNVVALRTLRFATGDARAQNEARRVVAEKIEATAAEVQGAAISAIMTGRKDAVVASKVLRVKRGRANKRRLSRR